MKILITGCQGFIGREMKEYFSDHEVIATDRTTLDPTCYVSVSNFFKKNKKIDIVIHTAVKGGKRDHKENIKDFYDNILMFDNLSKFSNKYGLMVNFGSGAEYGREREINSLTEQEIKVRYPPDYYGLSKNLITRKIIDINSNIFNLRLFGCFGKHEMSQRFLKASYNNIRNDQSIVIFQDKYMDYFYAEDVGKVIQSLPNFLHSISFKDINLCYNKKEKLSDIANRIKNLTTTEIDVIINNKELGSSYTGCNKRLQSLNIDFFGLDAGIKRTIEVWDNLNE